MRFFKLVIIIALLTVQPLYACDVNLFAIISGTSKQDAFTDKMNGLALAIKNLGDNYKNPEKSHEMLKNLMNSWIDFSSNFGQFPPEWAQKDENWSKKISELGHVIGNIRKNLGSEDDKAHAAMLKFSRRLPQLYENMPMDEKAKTLLAFTACFDRLWDAFYAQDLALLKAGVSELKEKCNKLRPLLHESLSKDMALLEEFTEQLRIMSTQINAFKTVTLQMVLISAEGQFVVMNDRISRQKDLSESTPAKSAEK